MTLIASQLFYALLPYRKRHYLSVLLMTAIGMALGQLWRFMDLPQLGIGEVALLPGLLFALALQTLVRFVPITFTERGPGGEQRLETKR